MTRETKPSPKKSRTAANAGAAAHRLAHRPDGRKSAMHRNPAQKIAVQKRLSKIEGQVRGLSRMVEDNRYCIDIVTQIAAVRAALRRAEEEILRDHVAHCVHGAIASGNQAEQRDKIDELMQVLVRADR
jgi:DNA-binding FrmR family transcriptional regulator